MHDLRFYASRPDVTIRDLAYSVGGVVKGDGDKCVVTVASAENAEANSVCFFEGRDKEAPGISSKALACFVRESQADLIPENVIRIIVDEPRKSFSVAALSFLERRTTERDWEDLGPARISPTAVIARGAILCDGVEIGDGTIIGPNAVIGPGVRIGRNCQISPGVVIETSLIGDSVSIKANSVIGGSGFGLIGSSAGLMPAPHFGRVILQDKVSIGSCVCIDRGAFEDTIIGEGTQLDNLVQIGHNVQIGRNTLIAAFGGLAGSVKVGDWVQMGGRVGVSDHLSIGSGSRMAAWAATMHDIPENETWAGIPAKPIKSFMREVAWLSKNAAFKPDKRKG